ncbi:MAG: sigma-70 family RNA polymerase sigma factor [Nitrospinota bacterium]|nr:MAG: sigma-70 family RNA polymerase sigma factor [Nitrospinota bacterium]
MPRRLQRFEALTVRYLYPLYRYARHLTRDAGKAEELVQETYLKAYQGWHRLRDDSRVKAWLFQILTNCYRDRYRQALRQPAWVELSAATEQEEEHGPVSTATTDPATLLERKEAIQSVQDAIAQLPPLFRMLVLLVDIEGFSYKETAEVLDIPLGTVISRLSRGRQRLRHLLQDYAIQAGYLPAGLPPAPEPDTPIIPLTAYQHRRRTRGEGGNG